MKEHYDGIWYSLKDSKRIDEVRSGIIKDGITSKDIISRANKRVKQYEKIRNNLPGGPIHWPDTATAIKNERNFLLFAFGVSSSLYSTSNLRGLIGAVVLVSPFWFIISAWLIARLGEYDTDHGTMFAVAGGVGAIGIFTYGLYIAIRNEQRERVREAWERGLLYNSHERSIIDIYDQTINKLNSNSNR